MNNRENNTMTSASLTIFQARRLQAALESKGQPVDLKTAWQLARAGQEVERSVHETLRQRAREDRVRKGMVAGWCDDMRSAGAWDGE